MNKYFYGILIGIIVLISSVFAYQSKELKKYKGLYDKERQNVEAYQLENSGLEGEIRQYQMSIDDLKQSKDSVDRKLVEVLKELKIKGKSIESLQYQSNIITKTDTLIMKDTIFTEKTHIDTLIGDKWYSLALTLDYPSKIVTSPTFNSEQYVIINTKKVFNNKPSKIFFIRWFQKKHTVVEVNTMEKNPYITNKESKFIKIIK